VTTQDSAEPIIHAQGKILYAETDAQQTPPAIDIDRIKARCNKKPKSKEIYAKFKSRGLQYGPSFQVMKN